MKSFLALLFLIPVLGGCSGEADVTVVNNTSRYVEGDFDGGEYFGIVAGGSANRTIEVGSFMKSSSEVDVNVAYHVSAESFSGIEFRKTFREKFKADAVYVLDLYTNSLGRPEAIVTTDADPGLAP